MRKEELIISTNIFEKKMSAFYYEWKYKFEETFRDFYEDCDKKGLY